MSHAVANVGAWRVRPIDRHAGTAFSHALTPACNAIGLSDKCNATGLTNRLLDIDEIMLCLSESTRQFI